MSKISISLIEGLHLTATDKRHIAEILRRRWSEGVTRHRRYSITERAGDTACVVIERKEWNDFGRLEIRRSKVMIRIGGGQSHA